MARQPYNVDTSQKKLEVYGSFGGGMVTQKHPEKLQNHESILIENANIIAGGVVENRGAYSQIHSNGGSITGKTQGNFLYNNLGIGIRIVAIDGRLYTVNGDVYTLLPITGLAQFQTTRPIEAVQDREFMYFATGSGLVKYNGVTAELVAAYTPTALEALYVGKNALAADPDNYITDTTGAGNAILGVTVSERYGVINVPVIFTAYVQKVSTDVLEYKFEVKTTDEIAYKVERDWNTSKTFTKSFTTRAEYMIRVTIRKQGTTVELSQYVVPRYKVNTTPEPNPEPTINAEDLNLCNRLFIHYDRLYLYGDTGNPDLLYVSHLHKFSYVPRTNTLKVTDPLRGGLNAIVRYKEYLLCFTDNSIQLVSGTNPKVFQKIPVHTTLGTKHGYSVQVMKNYIVFVGNDNGVYVLKSFNYASNDKMNVERIDDSIKDEIESNIKGATKIISTIYNNQLYLYTENGSIRYVWRFYHDIGVWVRDVLPFSLMTMTTENNKLITSSDVGGTIHELKSNVFFDGTNSSFTMHLISKNFNFDMPHHRKKFKQYQLLTKITASTTIIVKVFADDTLITAQSLTYDPLQFSDAHKLKVMASGRFRYTSTDISIDVVDNVQLVGFAFIFKENTPK
jgi:hypothetical protein